MDDPQPERRILVLNAGSSSIKFAVFDGAACKLIAGMAEEIGGPQATLSVGGTQDRAPLPDHAAALGAILSALAARGYDAATLAAAGHRVVHGGATLSGPVRITPQVDAEIAACARLAPLHNPHNLAAIRALATLVPGLPQFACFDTAFHSTNPPVATRYAVPDVIAAKGIRRYGFHGISYAGLVEALPDLTGTPLPRRLLAMHLGNGASLCAIVDGLSVATTMGYSPLEGLTMGTRPGSIDANAVLQLAEDHGIAETRRMLNNRSGLMGLSGGTTDMRRLLAEDSSAARFAVAHFCYWSLRHAGSLVAAMRGVDAIVFTGGIGEHAAPIRARIVEGLDWLGASLDEGANSENALRLHDARSRVAIHAVPAREERTIAGEVLRLMDAEAAA